MANGDFVWYEYMTRDVETAKKFYEAVAGWNTRDAEFPGETYLVLSAGERMVAGIYGRGADCPPDAPTEWLGYIADDDVDAATERVRQSGGRVHKEPAEMAGIGRFRSSSIPKAR